MASWLAGVWVFAPHFFFSFPTIWEHGTGYSALYFGSSGPGSGPGQGHCVVFLGKILYSHGASLHLGVQMGAGEFWG